MDSEAAQAAAKVLADQQKAEEEAAQAAAAAAQAQAQAAAQEQAAAAAAAAAAAEQQQQQAAADAAAAAEAAAKQREAEEAEAKRLKDEQDAASAAAAAAAASAAEAAAATAAAEAAAAAELQQQQQQQADADAAAARQREEENRKQEEDAAAAAAAAAADHARREKEEYDRKRAEEDAAAAAQQEANRGLFETAPISTNPTDSPANTTSNAAARLETVGSQLRKSGLGSLANIPRATSVVSQNTQQSADTAARPSSRPSSRKNSVASSTGGGGGSGGGAVRSPNLFPLEISASMYTPGTLSLHPYNADDVIVGTWQKRLDDVYTKYLPKKKETMNAVLQNKKFKGSEDKIFDKFCAKYNDEGIIAYRNPTAEDGIQQVIVEAHNGLRQLHNARPLIFDPEKAKRALQYATDMMRSGRCIPGNTTNPQGSEDGQNVWSGTILPGETEGDLLQRAIGDWYSAQADRARDLSAFAKFSQIVWKSAATIGGYVMIDSDRSAFVVVNYGPGKAEQDDPEALYANVEIPGQDLSPEKETTQRTRSDLASIRAEVEQNVSDTEQRRSSAFDSAKTIPIHAQKSNPPSSDSTPIPPIEERQRNPVMPALSLEPPTPIEKKPRKKKVPKAIQKGPSSPIGAIRFERAAPPLPEAPPPVGRVVEDVTYTDCDGDLIKFTLHGDGVVKLKVGTRQHKKSVAGVRMGRSVAPGAKDFVLTVTSHKLAVSATKAVLRRLAPLLSKGNVEHNIPDEPGSPTTTPKRTTQQSYPPPVYWQEGDDTVMIHRDDSEEKIFLTITPPEDEEESDALGAVRLLVNKDVGGVYHSLHFPELKKAVEIPSSLELHRLYDLFESHNSANFSSAVSVRFKVKHDIPPPPEQLAAQSAFAAVGVILLHASSLWYEEKHHNVREVIRLTGSPERRARIYLDKHRNDVDGAISAMYASGMAPTAPTEDTPVVDLRANINEFIRLTGSSEGTARVFLKRYDNNVAEALHAMSSIHPNNNNTRLEQNDNPMHAIRQIIGPNIPDGVINVYLQQYRGDIEETIQALRDSGALTLGDSTPPPVKRGSGGGGGAARRRFTAPHKLFQRGFHLQFHRGDLPLRGVGHIHEVHGRLEREVSAPFNSTALPMTLLGGDARAAAALFPNHADVYTPAGAGSVGPDEALHLSLDRQAKRNFLVSYTLALKGIGLEVVDCKSGAVKRPSRRKADAGWSRPAESDRFRILNTKDGANLRRLVTRLIGALDVFGYGHMAPPFVRFLAEAVVLSPHHLGRCRDACVKWVSALRDPQHRNELLPMLSAIHNNAPWKTTRAMSPIPSVPEGNPLTAGPPSRLPNSPQDIAERIDRYNNNNNTFHDEESFAQSGESAMHGDQQQHHHSYTPTRQIQRRILEEEVYSRERETPPRHLGGGGGGGGGGRGGSYTGSVAAPSPQSVEAKREREAVLLQYLASVARATYSSAHILSGNGATHSGTGLPKVRLEEDETCYRLLIAGGAQSIRVAVTDTAVTIRHVGDATLPSEPSIWTVLTDELTTLDPDDSHQLRLSAYERTLHTPQSIVPALSKKEPYGVDHTLCTFPKAGGSPLRFRVPDSMVEERDGGEAVAALSPRRPSPPMLLAEGAGSYRLVLRGAVGGLDVRPDISSLTIIQQAMLVPAFDSPSAQVVVDELTVPWQASFARFLQGAAAPMVESMKAEGGEALTLRVLPPCTRLFPLSKPVLPSKMKISAHGHSHTLVMLPLLPESAQFDI